MLKPASDGSISATQYTYTGTAPIRMMTYAEYNFIRAEAAVLGSAWYCCRFIISVSIRASMSMAGVSSAQTEDYIAANGQLTGTDDEKIKKSLKKSM